MDRLHACILDHLVGEHFPGVPTVFLQTSPICFRCVAVRTYRMQPSLNARKPAQVEDVISRIWSPSEGKQMLTRKLSSLV